MIVDSLDRWSLYFRGGVWQEAFDFLAGLTPDTEAKKYPLRGDQLYGIVAAYETRPRESGKFEVHRKYVDVQVLLSGTEVIEYCPAGDIDTFAPYDADKDAALAGPPPPAVSIGGIRMRPGLFAVFYPQDAHMPSLALPAGPGNVKKAVAKISVDAV